jgi:Zn-dependent peptidase ImmA (M78 family)
VTRTVVNQDDATWRPAEREARELLRSAWQYDSEGKFVVPVDPFVIARRLGLRVFAASLEPDVSGMLVKRPGQDAEVYVNGDDHENRQRFSCAHEIGHYILRAGKPDDSFGYIDRRGQMASAGTNPAEIFANQFAAELLMPQDAVRAAYEDSTSLASLAVKFQVSLEAMRYRLENLGILR